MTLLLPKKLYYFLESRAAAPVVTTTLGLPCTRPKEVVDWYTNGDTRRMSGTRVRALPNAVMGFPRTVHTHCRAESGAMVTLPIGRYIAAVIL